MQNDNSSYSPFSFWQEKETFNARLGSWSSFWEGNSLLVKISFSFLQKGKLSFSIPDFGLEAVCFHLAPDSPSLPGQCLLLLLLQNHKNDDDDYDNGDDGGDDDDEIHTSIKELLSRVDAMEFVLVVRRLPLKY